MERPRFCGECGGQYFWPRNSCQEWICYACGAVETEKRTYPKSEINCEELLIKYMNYVRDVEGTTFIPESVKDCIRFTSNPFTEAELARLQELSDQIYNK